MGLFVESPRLSLVCLNILLTVMEVVGLLIGKDKSMGVPGKNVRLMLGRPMCEYGFIAGKAAGVSNLFVSTDSEQIAQVGSKYDAIHIPRPPELATPESLTEDVLKHAYSAICKHLNRSPDVVILLFANNPAINIDLINEGIDLLKNDPSLDSAFSVCRYDMFSPQRARKISDSGLIEAFDSRLLDDKVSSIRSSQGGVYFCDLSVQIIRSRCFTQMDTGMQPFQWMGTNSKALFNDFGFDVDSEWQFKVLEYWLTTKGFTETSIYIFL